ncbi:hypothetical protein DPEC_G00018870 [Dallia pectoralis]|uniref:Uncharacterized protein n=1 Tax=Dallia pectoralis TaxID=75939 RepID=A0ACC2HFF1_DALPE|nr:hypothetical protein DPEC_G00018870 [Dallia pectoralis]
MILKGLPESYQPFAIHKTESIEELTFKGKLRSYEETEKFDTKIKTDNVMKVDISSVWPAMNVENEIAANGAAASGAATTGAQHIPMRPARGTTGAEMARNRPRKNKTTMMDKPLYLRSVKALSRTLLKEMA